MRLLSLLSITSLAVASPLQAQSIPGGGPTAVELMKQCFDGTIGGTISNPVCTGYLAGFIGAVRIAATVSENFPICLPDPIGNLQIVNDISAHLEANQDQLEKSARSIVFLVLTERYPCQSL